jgi:retron-type reverse transcriptase
MQAGVPQGSVLSPILYNIYINDNPQTNGVYLALFADDTSLCATEGKEGFVLRKLQRGLDAIATCCERWNIKINEEKSQVIFFSHRRRQPEPPLTLNERSILFVNSVKYLGVVFDKRIT